jgi:tRNA pseudouridine55 synthase
VSAPSGLLVVDKPAGMTSHDVVSRVRRLAGTRRVGHAGTLDPAATGILVIGVEKATKLLGHLALTDKDYAATIRLGATTSTDDAESDVVERAAPEAVAAVTDDDLRGGIAALTGTLSQVPSSVSAVKVDGKRAYARVRAGEQVDLAPRQVTVSAFDLVQVRRPTPGVIDLDVLVTCTSGTYVRALARDLGAGLGIGGHLTALRRTRVGPYGLDVATALADLAPAEPQSGLSRAGLAGMVPLAEAVAAAFPRLDVDEATARAIGFGQPVAAPERAPGLLGEEPVTYGVFGPDGDVLALMAGGSGPVLRSVVVFAAR